MSGFCAGRVLHRQGQSIPAAGNRWSNNPSAKPAGFLPRNGRTDMSKYWVLRSFRSAIVSAALLLLGVTSAHAAYPCVTSSDELQTALSGASIKSTPYEIHLVASATPYQLGPGNNFVYLPNNTTIKGGYKPGCAAQFDDASGTIIDLGGYGIGFFPNDDDNSSRFEFDSLTIRHGNFYAHTGFVGVFSDEIGYIIIHDTRFTGLANDQDIAPISFNAVKGALQMVNVQFDHLSQTSADPCAVHIFGENDSTFTANFITADLSNGKDFCLDASSEGGTFNARIDNSIIWGSDNASPDTSTIRGMDSSGHGHPLNLSTHYDLSHAFIGYGTLTTTYQLSGDPHWMNPAAGDYRLADIGSPAVNTGSATGALGVPYYDINLGLRTVGSHPDRGAHESPFDDSTILTVINTNDDLNPGSLRSAITNANLYGGVHTIAFNLGVCPAVIYLAAPLPAISSAITVDGYTQPGSAPNDSDLVFDANLCVLIKPATTATSAFRASNNASGGTNASLTLRGVGIGGFGQDVILLGGSNHAILGNQFGGTVNGVDLGHSALSDITIGTDADSFIIGSFDAASRNIIGGSTAGNGINIQAGVVSDPDHCQIVNNWIGLAPDGATALPNAFGLNLSGSGCSAFGNYLVGNSVYQLWINGGHDNVVQQNIVGYTVYAEPLPNTGVGILVAGDNNVIGGSATGVAPGPLLANIVGYESGGGIAVSSGVGNSIRGNYVSFNGPNYDGAGMDIDLGKDGPTANGAVNTGPNNLQHFAVIDKLLFQDYPPVGNPNSLGVLTGHLDGAPGTYKVDVYFSTFCSAATGRGHAENYLRDLVVTIPGGNTTASFTVSITLPSDIGFNGLSLTATSVINGTSEMGTCFPVSSGVNDAIFKSGFGIGAEY
jgi:hypothetical protein